jgi:hypothetical protein
VIPPLSRAIASGRLREAYEILLLLGPPDFAVHALGELTGGCSWNDEHSARCGRSDVRRAHDGHGQLRLVCVEHETQLVATRSRRRS